MNATTWLSVVGVSALVFTAGCAATPSEDEAGGSSSAVAQADCSENVTPGTDIPGADADSLCIVTADLGAKMRAEATASSTNLLDDAGWGGLPCGYQFRVNLRDSRAAMLGAKANNCSVWSYGSALVNGDEMSGFVNASLFKCRRADETNAEFAKRFTPTCTNFASGNDLGASRAPSATCEPGPGWRKVASHPGIALEQGSGSDSALVSTSSPTRIAAIFKAYRLNWRGETDYVGCFSTPVSGTYGANVSAAYSLYTTEGFFEHEGPLKTYATWADVDYYVVQGSASIK